MADRASRVGSPELAGEVATGIIAAAAAGALAAHLTGSWRVVLLGIAMPCVTAAAVAAARTGGLLRARALAVPGRR